MDRRIFLLLLAGVALAALATACGGGSQAAARTPAATASAETATKPAASATTSVQSAPTPVPEPSATAVEQVPTDTPVVAATPAPTPTQAPPPPTLPPTGGAASVRIAAINTLFSPASLTAPAGATVTLTLDNQDAGVTHDIVIFDASGGQIGATDLGTGPIVQTVTFAVGGPGNYSFKCSVHPQQMRGLLKVE
ncbi:MAG TPA: cupredoxin domain-containing protein [Dehalococcoidia bacterium]|nr:cupredoxin domain-containing protein [Dehalococcoidia bacterium]